MPFKPSYNEIPSGFTFGTLNPFGVAPTFALTSPAYDIKQQRVKALLNLGLDFGGVNYLSGTTLTIPSKTQMFFGVAPPINPQVRPVLFCSGGIFGLSSATGLTARSGVVSYDSSFTFGTTPQDVDPCNIFNSQFGPSSLSINVNMEPCVLRPRISIEDWASGVVGIGVGFYLSNSSAASVTVDWLQISVEVSLFEEPDLGLELVQ